MMLFYSNKGVNVELGIPYEMWDQPSAEVTTMQSNVCDFCVCVADSV